MNQARLFAIDTRLKETEDFRVKEISFVKDAVRKLIFALEQAEIQKSMATTTPTSAALVATSPGGQRARMIKGEGGEVPLPTLMINKNRAHSSIAQATTNSKRGGTSLKDATSGTGSPERYTERQVITSHIPAPIFDATYLKRLHFIKAAIN